jgi:hypothetical protein
MNRALLTAAVLALAAANLPEDRDEGPRRRPSTAAGGEPRHVPDPEGERIKAELREKRRQNFLKQKKHR